MHLHALCLHALPIGVHAMGARVSAETVRALGLVSKGATPYAAALKCGIEPSTVYRAIERIKVSGRSKKIVTVRK